MKVIYNSCFGNFNLSDEALKKYNEYRSERGLGPARVRGLSIRRNDSLLIRVVEELGELANGKSAKLKIEVIPDRFEECYEIREYDGVEEVLISPGLLTKKTVQGRPVNKLTDAECRNLIEGFVLAFVDD